MVLFISATSPYRDGAIKLFPPTAKFQFDNRQNLFRASFSSPVIHRLLRNRRNFFPVLRCEKDDDHIKHISVERPPYSSYFDTSSGQMEPASGARPSIPDQNLWPEGTADRVRAAMAPEPTGESSGTSSRGRKPGSRRKKHKSSAVSTESESAGVIVEDGSSDSEEIFLEEPKDVSSEYVVYEEEGDTEALSGYDLDRKLGRPHPFIDPEKRREVEGTLTNDELWWNWRKPENEQWSRWQRRKPDVETVFLKAMAETGEVKLYGDHPTMTETSLYRARKHLYKEERLKAEQKKLENIGPMAYYSEWVKSWKGDTSKEAIQKHFEETGEDETAQLIEMFCHQTDREYRIMMGTDLRIKRDPLAMRLREDQIKEIWGGDPVYPTVNYVQDPNEIIDFRGPDFHEPTPDMLDFLKEHGKVISREELQRILSSEKAEQIEMSDMDEAMARAVDIGENDDEDEEENEEVEVEVEESEEEIGDVEEGDNLDVSDRNWSIKRTTPYLRKSKGKSKKNEDMNLDEAIVDSDNLTDFLMDFEED